MRIIRVLSATISTHIATASGPGHVRANMHASKWALIAEEPEVAAAHREVASAPVCCRKIPSFPPAGELAAGDFDISEARQPYALIKSGVEGMICSNRAPSLRAVWCGSPSSAMIRRCSESELPSPVNSTGGWILKREKSKVKFARAKVFSL